MSWTYAYKKFHTFPPGTYYIGDLCYPMGKTDTYDMWVRKYAAEDGLYLKNATTGFLVFSFGSDGDYPGSDGHTYVIDSGSLGIASVDLFDMETFKKNYGPDLPGTIHTFTEPVHVKLDYNENVVISNANIHIEIPMYEDDETDEE